MTVYLHVYLTYYFISLSIAHDYVHGEPFVLQEENFHWNLNFAISLIANSLKLNSAYRYIFKSLTMKAYMSKFKY